MRSGQAVSSLRSVWQNSIEGINFENYPKVDGSTSASVLNTMVACKLLGVSYFWVAPGIVSEWFLQPKYEDLPEQYKDFFGQRVKTSQTYGAFINLIDGNADIILTHRTISPDEKAHANDIGVTLIETPIALDAFVFVVNKNKPVKSLTVNQVQKIYTGEITNWSQIGGNDVSIKGLAQYPYYKFVMLYAHLNPPLIFAHQGSQSDLSGFIYCPSLSFIYHISPAIRIGIDAGYMSTSFSYNMSTSVYPGGSQFFDFTDNLKVRVLNTGLKFEVAF